MRVCILNEFFYPENTGGTGTVLSELARHLRDDFDDVTVEVVTSRNLYRMSSGKLPSYENWQGIAIHRLSSPRSNTHSVGRRLFANLLFAVVALLFLLRARRFDVLLVGTAPPTTPLAAILYKWLTGTPYVYITYDLEPDRAVTLGVFPEQHILVRFLKKVQSQWLHAAAKVVVLGRCMQDHVIRSYNLPADKVETIPIGFEPAKVSPQSRESQFRQKTGLSGFVVLYAGNFGWYHNFDTVLDAAKRLMKEQPTVQFALIGNGANRAHILKRVEAEGLTNVYVYPFVPEEAFEDMLATADLFLVTLEPGMEGLCVPSKLYSMLAAGRPTIGLVGARSEVARVLTETNSGVQLEQGDVEGLVCAIGGLLQFPDLLDRMGSNARRTLVEHYASSLIAYRYYQVLKDAVFPIHEVEVNTTAVVDTMLLDEVSSRVEPR